MHLALPYRRARSIRAATDPVGGLDHSLPIHPGEGSSKPLEYWEDRLHRRRERRRPPRETEERPEDHGDHQVDDYA